MLSLSSPSTEPNEGTSCEHIEARQSLRGNDSRVMWPQVLAHVAHKSPWGCAVRVSRPECTDTLSILLKHGLKRPA